MTDPRSVYAAIARGAAEATGAATAIVVGRHGEDVHVLAVEGEAQGRAVGEDVMAGESSLGFVLASGQALSLARREAPEGGDASDASLCVPCLGTVGVLGALELRGRPDADSFTPEAGRLAALFADVAAASLAAGDLGAEPGPSPAELGAELAQLAEADPARYGAVASVIGALLAHG